MVGEQHADPLLERVWRQYLLVWLLPYSSGQTSPLCALPDQATYPLDLVRTRLAYDTSDGDAARRVTGSQAGASGQPPSRNPGRTIRGVLAATLREEGVRGLYRGIGPTMCGILPYAGLKFYVYQTLKQRYRRRARPAPARHTGLDWHSSVTV